MTMQVKHTIISASAGSGKTYRLTNRAIALFVLGAKLDSVLATTFSRRAAGEIRDRILGRLARAASNSNDRAALHDAIAAEVQGASASTFGDDFAHTTLTRLLNDVQSLRVGTIDSVFSKIVASVQSGVSPSIVPADAHELDEIALEAVVRMFADARSDPKQHLELTVAVSGILKGRLGRRIVQTITKELADLLPLYRCADASAWEWTAAGGFPSVSEIEACWKALEEALKRDALASDPKAARHALKIREHCAGTTPGNSKVFEPLSRLILDPNDADAWSLLGKSTLLINAPVTGKFGSNAIPPSVLAAALALAELPVRALERIYIDRTRSTRVLLEKYDRALLAILRERGLVTFDGVAHAAGNIVERWSSAKAGAISASESPYGNTNHLLLDEFQDTSLQQWGALRPLVAEIVQCAPSTIAPAPSFFCVGDVKQSIYGWRGGEPSLLRNLPLRIDATQDLSSRLQCEPLATTYRSRQAIMDCVNALFSCIHTNAAVTQFQRGKAAIEWEKSFETHVIAKKLKLLPAGEVHLSLIENLKGEALKTATVAKIVERAADLLEQGVGKIAVLVASNAMVGYIVQALRAKGIDAAGRAGGSLEDSAAANAVLDAFRFAHCAEDLPALFNVVHSPLGKLLKLSDALLPASSGSSKHRARASFDLRRDIFKAGCARWIDQQRTTLDASAALCPRDHRRLTQLAAFVEQLELSAGHRGSRSLGELASAAAQCRVDDDSEGGSGASVEVVNFHQSKGLEWDAVIISELTGRIERQLTVGVARGANGRPSRVMRAVSKDLTISNSFDETMEATRSADFEERLSILYVAATRAKAYLEFVMPATISKAKPKNGVPVYLKQMASVVHAGIAGAVDPAVALLKPVLLFGDAGSAAQGRVQRESTGTSRVITPRAPKSRGGRTRPLSAAYALAEQDDRAMSVGTAGAQAGLDARHRGLVAHEVLGSIDWLGATSPNGFALDASVRVHIASRLVRLLPERESSWIQSEISVVEALIASWSDLRAFLSLAKVRNGASAHAMRERPFVYVGKGSEAGRVRTGSIDRLELVGKPGAWTSAEVIDYKTDHIHSSEVKAKGEHHRPQLEAYRVVVAEQYGLPLNAITMTLVFLHPRVIHTL